VKDIYLPSAQRFFNGLSKPLFNDFIMIPSESSLKLTPSGDYMPLVGFGLFLISLTGLMESRWKVGKETTADTIVTAVKTGYRLFDCAQDYGNEKVIQLRVLVDGIGVWRRHPSCN